MTVMYLVVTSAELFQRIGCLGANLACLVRLQNGEAKLPNPCNAP
jgi:hypothetical protein